MCARLAGLSGCFLLISTGLAGVFDATARAQEGRPNVVLIVTNEQGFGDMGRAGELDCNDPLADPANCQHPLETALQAAGLDGFTPNLDRLSREGIRFSVSRHPSLRHYPRCADDGSPQSENGRCDTDR